MRPIGALTLGLLLVATGCASRAELDRVADEAARQQRVAARNHERANNAEAQLRRMQAELRKAKEQARRTAKACEPAPPASKSREIDPEAIENCVATMRMLTPDGGSQREWLRACGHLGR